MFHPNENAYHDAIIDKVHAYLMNKSVEIIHAGRNVVLDWGFWTPSSRKEVSEFYYRHGIVAEWHYLDIEEEAWLRNVKKRNGDVLNGKTTDYFVDSGLRNKLEQLFVPPLNDEMDVWVRRGSMNDSIRAIYEEEIDLLDTFLYEAIFIPEGVPAPERDIIYQPELQVYVKDFGKQEGDICFVAEVDGRIVGAVWVRIMDDYGHVEDGVPSFAISLYKEYRGLGIGTKLMERMLAELKSRGYKKASLAVQKANYAVKLYKKVGFEIVDENDEEYIMICNL